MGVASALLLSACSVVGIRTVEEPRHRVVAQVGAAEIRTYEPRLAAEVMVPGDELAARSAGFQILAGYIFGANRARAKIAMTAPVAQSAGAEAIAMTAPVDQARVAGGWRIRFFMPANYTRETLPVPNDARVEIVTVPEQTVAVLRYTGSTSPASVKDASARLLQSLDRGAWRAVGQPVAWFYDPPWTLPPLRRNEIAVEVMPG